MNAHRPKSEPQTNDYRSPEWKTSAKPVATMDKTRRRKALVYPLLSNTGNAPRRTWQNDCQTPTRPHLSSSISAQSVRETRAVPKQSGLTGTQEPVPAMRSHGWSPGLHRDLVPEPPIPVAADVSRL